MPIPPHIKLLVIPSVQMVDDSMVASWREYRRLRRQSR